MAFHVRDPLTDAAVRELASVKGLTLTEAIRQAVQHELQRLEQAKKPLSQRVDALQSRIEAFGRTGLEADKAFYDDLSGDL
jgi:antitoxin VapB